MNAQRQHALFTEQEYYYTEEFSITKREFFRGEVFAIAGTTGKHNDIAGNIYIAFRSQLRDKACNARISDQRIRVEANSLITYPDVVVVCPPFNFDPTNKITLLDATMIVEVLSDSTRAYDLGEKFNLARELPSLRHYVLVEPDEIRVEHRFRRDDGEWEAEVFTGREDEIELRAIECRLSVCEVYDEIEGI
jgi:Uma2 family endonuclease